MFSRGGFDAKASRRKLPGTEEAIDALVALAQDNPDKALVMNIGQLVVNGYAEWEMLDKRKGRTSLHLWRDLSARTNHNPQSRLIG